MLKDTGERSVRYLLAANEGLPAVNVRLTFPTYTINSVTSVFDNRTINITGNSFTDTFDSFGVRLYKITIKVNPVVISDLRALLARCTMVFSYNSLVNNYGK